MLYPVEIDVCPGFGWQSSPEFNTDIRMLRSGREKRRGLNDLVRHRYILPYQNIPSSAYLLKLKAAFLAVRGSLHAFLVKDASDFLAVDDPLGLAPAGSAAVQLVHLADFEGVASYERIITKPLAASVIVKQNGVVKAGAADPMTGMFVPTTAWTPGAVLTWSGEFRVPVRFASDSLPMSIDNKFNTEDYAMNGQVDLVEVFGE